VGAHVFDNIQSEFIEVKFRLSKWQTLHMTYKNARVVGSLDFDTICCFF